MTSAQRGVQGLAVLLEAEHEGLVVEARGEEADPLRVGPDQLGQERLGVTDRVAQAVHPAELAALVHRPGQHGHRVAVAEQVGVRADLGHVPGQRHRHRDRAQAAEDPADAQRVPDRLAHPVPGRDVEVGPGGGVPADLHLVDDIAGSGQRRAPVRGRGYRRLGPGLLGDPAGQPLGVRQPLLADVVQREVQAAAELRVAAQVRHHVPGELDAACSDERHCDHQLVSVTLTAFSCKILHLPDSGLHNTEQFMMT